MRVPQEILVAAGPWDLQLGAGPEPETNIRVLGVSRWRWELRRTGRRAEGSVSMRTLTTGGNRTGEREVGTSPRGMGLGVPPDPRLCLLPGLIATPLPSCKILEESERVCVGGRGAVIPEACSSMLSLGSRILFTRLPHSTSQSHGWLQPQRRPYSASLGPARCSGPLMI